MSGSMNDADQASPAEWKDKYMALEALLMKFRRQMSVIRDLTTEKIQQLETQVLEAERRADKANQQMQWMEEHLKDTDVKSGHSELKLFRHCQDLQAALQEKEELMILLKQQLKEQTQGRIQDAKIVEEKAAKIKEWVAQKLNEFEVENTSLRETNQQQEFQILELKRQIQVLEQVIQRRGSDNTKPGHAQRLSSLTFGCFHAQEQSTQMQTGSMKDCQNKVISEVEAVSSSPRMATERGSSLKSHIHPDQSAEAESRELTHCGLEDTNTVQPVSNIYSPQLAGADAATMDKASKDRVEIEDGSSDELNKQFRMQRLNSSSSSGEANTPSPIPTPKRPTASQDTPASPKQPRLRSPNAFSVSIALDKKHLSQPSMSSETALGRTCNIMSMLHPLKPQESDLTQKQKMEICDGKEPSEEPSKAPVEELESPDTATSLPGSKPPTPPLHRFPSWERRIYAVAKSGIHLSETLCTDGADKDSSHLSTYPAFMLYTSFIYRNMSTSGYTTVKGREALVSSTRFSEEFSTSEEEGLDDCHSNSGEEESSLHALGSNCGKSQENSLRRAVSLSSESDYAIPPDACSTDTECSEPEKKLQKTCSSSSDGDKSEPMEKSGYLFKMVKTWKKIWKRHWFVLKDGELMYYKSPSDVVHKPQGQIELTASSTITRGDGKQILQVLTGKHGYNLKADSPNLLEEWLKILQCVQNVKAAIPIFTQPSIRPAMKGYLTSKMKHDCAKREWCALIGKTLYYFRSQEDKFPLGQIKLTGAHVGDMNLHEDTKNGESMEFTIIIQMLNQSPIYLYLDSSHEKAAWLYHLSVAAHTNMGQVGTEFEQLVGKLISVNGNPGSELWRHSILCFSEDALSTPLTTLPCQALQTEAIKLFKTCQLFINVVIDTPAIDYHVTLAQCALQVCLSHPELQNEIYCQLIKQTYRRQPHGQPGPMQAWRFLALCVGLFLPQHHILWLLQIHLKNHADPRTEVGKYAIYCQRSMERTQQKCERQARPSRMEILSILLRNPYHHSMPFSVPVHFLNNTYQVVGFDASTTVEEFLNDLNQDTGMRKTRQSGFSLYSDDPTGQNIEHYLQGSLMICDIISKWEQACKCSQISLCIAPKSVKFTYKSRLYFSHQLRGETEIERLLLAYQTNEEISAGHFPINKELAIEMSALLSQVEFGDFECPFPSAASSGSGQAKSTQTLKQVLERFYPKHYRRTCSEEQMRQLIEQISARWVSLRGRSASECVRIYLSVARKWPFFGAKLFEAEPQSPSSLPCTHVWVAVHEDGLSVLTFTSMKLLVSFSKKNIITFGGCRQDFMLEVTQSFGNSATKEMATEKYLFAMSTVKVRELTLLMASYINSTYQQQTAAHHLSAPALLFSQCQSGEHLTSKTSPVGSGKARKVHNLL